MNTLDKVVREVSRRLVDDCGLTAPDVMAIPNDYWRAMMHSSFVMVHVEQKGILILPPETPASEINKML